jgi:signal transduction histidine kinase/HAMP domain-containing protein
MTRYTGRTDLTSSLFRDNSSDGATQWTYVAPGSGRDWSVIMSVPVRYTQQQVINIAAPLLIIIIVSTLLAIVFMRYGLGRVTTSLRTLAIEADRMSHGYMDKPLQVSGEDEVGQLGKAFEQMRRSLEDRLDELNRLLLVSQGVASNLELEESLKLVLESALLTGASSVRVVLAPSVVPELDGDKASSSYFGAGSAGDKYRYLDDQVLTLTRRQDRLILTNLTRPRILAFSQSIPRPSALIAVALKHETLFYGVLWVAFDQSHQFEDQEIRYISTLASQAASAVANAHHFLGAEIGRQRLEAILTSTPDPVLVTNSKDRLLLANKAAWHILGINMEASRDQPIHRIISIEPLVKLLRSPSEEKQSAEIVLPDGQILLATTSSVIAEGRRVGRVCILRDVTQFKKLDALKSEFVSTVSHDLRSPLTLIRGYTTMLKMVGELDTQQSNYLEKISESVENMDRLVNNLLDLSRIEAGVGLQLEKISIQDVIERVVEEFRSFTDQKRINLEVDIDQQEIPLVEADRALLQQALHNLVDNAIKFTEPGGKVQIRLKLHKDQLVFEVEDSGIGISPADQQRMFEKFYRASRQSISGERGSGLGLAIVKSIAERHGGRVWFESQLGKGSTFFLALPLHHSHNHLTESEFALD